MHIPDGFLSVLVSIIFWAISAIVIRIALRKTSKQLGERTVPLMGVLAAAIFAAQMLNFTVAGGTSGHLLGASLAVILLGPWPAVLVMTAVISVQALFFQDGGIFALGANLFNMGIVGVFVAYATYSVIYRLFRNQARGVFIAGFIAAWLSIFITSLSCAIQLALSGTSPANIAIPAMAAIHALIGVGEGLITTGALVFLRSVRKDLIEPAGMHTGGNRGIVIIGSLIALILVMLSPLASSHPDGLEWVAGKNGFLAAAANTVRGFFPDYSVPGITNPALAKIAAGILGILIVISLVYGVASAEKAKKHETPLR
jgi:cobalt/nickel transport system permease protein